MSSMSPKKLAADLDSPIERLIWSMRMAKWNREFPSSYEEMSWGDPPSLANFYRSIEVWKFLAPFFASKGYILYECTDANHPWYPPSCSPNTMERPVYPFSRVILDNHILPGLVPNRPSVWPARDRFGRDLIIKVISNASQPSDELRVMQRLNDKTLRSDPFNHTIHALEFLTFNDLVFVVMPRWDGAFYPDFEVVSELMDITKTYLETFVFLHKHRIVHHDFLQQNTGMNIVAHRSDLFERKGLRDPSAVRYTLFDFGMSIMYPEDSVIEEIVDTRPLGFRLRGAPSVEGPYNPFKADIALMGLVLQLKVRHIEHVVPELGPFFDRLVDTLDPTQFTAEQALSRFLDIYNGLSASQLQEPVHTWVWLKGESLKKGVGYCLE